MKIKDFGVEIWMNAYENSCTLNLAETCVESITVKEVLEMAGDKGEFYSSLLNLKLTYGDIEGSTGLLDAICSLYENQSHKNISVTHGAIGANGLTFLTLVERGDKVISVLPTYQQHYSIPESIEADTHILRLTPENGWLPDLEKLAEMATANTKLICINNPNNPSGSVMDKEYLLKIVEIARKCDAYLLCDEAYRGLTHTGESFTESVADLYEKGISTASMSKTFSAAGVRLGWIAGPCEFIEKVSKQRDYHVISVSGLDDKMATLILQNKDKMLKRNLEICNTNAKILKDFVDNEELIDYVPPKGGTTAFLKYNFDMKSKDLCIDLLNETGVLLLPGSALDVEGYLRIGYCNNTQIIKDGLAKFKVYLNKYRSEAK